MSGSITDSDAGPQDWDETWTPSGVTQDEKFTWKQPWQKMSIIVRFTNGHKQEHISSCLLPVKMQFVVRHHLPKLQKVIKNIKDIRVQHIATKDEFLEVDISSPATGDIISMIENSLINAFDDSIIMKTTQLYKFTPSLAEEQFRKQMKARNVDLTRDDKKVFIVGFSNIKSYIDQGISAIMSKSVKKIEYFKENWKMKAIQEFNLIESLSKMFDDVIISVEVNSVIFHGRDGRVRDAIIELNKNFSDLYVEILHVDPLLIELLALPQVSVFFNQLLRKEHLLLVWTPEGEKLMVFSKSKIQTEILRSIIHVNFLVVGFPKSHSASGGFCSSSMFRDCTQKHVGKTLISKSTESAINIASTKAIVQDLMFKEKAYDTDPRNTKDTQVNIMDDLLEQQRMRNEQLGKEIKDLRTALATEITAKRIAESTAGSLRREIQEKNNLTKDLKTSKEAYEDRIRNLEHLLMQEQKRMKSATMNAPEAKNQLILAEEKYQRKLKEYEDIIKELNFKIRYLERKHNVYTMRTEAVTNEKNMSLFEKTLCKFSNKEENYQSKPELESPLYWKTSISNASKTLAEKETDVGMQEYKSVHRDDTFVTFEDVIPSLMEKTDIKSVEDCSDLERNVMVSAQPNKYVKDKVEEWHARHQSGNILKKKFDRFITSETFGYSRSIEGKITKDYDRKHHDSKVQEDIFTNFKFMVNPKLQLETADVEKVCNREKIQFNPYTMEVECSVEQLKSLNQSLIDKSSSAVSKGNFLTELKVTKCTFLASDLHFE